jgi:hypothetical protein
MHLDMKTSVVISTIILLPAAIILIPAAIILILSANSSQRLLYLAMTLRYCCLQCVAIVSTLSMFIGACI